MAGLTPWALALLAAVGAPAVPVPPGDLQTALEAARPGDTLLLEPGIHSGPVLVERRVRITGRPGAVLQGDLRGTTLVLAADGIVVEGLVVRGSGEDLSSDDAVIRLHEAQGVTVRGCQVEARAFGIYVRGGGHHRIVGNVVRGDASIPLNRRGNGIHLWHTVSNLVRGNDLAEVRDGIYLSFAHENEIVDNAGEGQRYGIHYMYSERNTLRGNRFSRCTGGIALMFSMRNRVEENETVDNRDFGLLCQQLEETRIAGNRIERNGRGIYLENSAGNRVEKNLIASNGVGAYLTAGSERNLFHENRFDGNLVQVFQDRAGANSWWDEGRGNYWSDYAGFDWDGDGIGETPYRLQTTASALMAHRPAARWFWMSPALSLLDWWDAQVDDRGAVPFDWFPLVDSKAGGP